jgi:hypothetical protein
MDSIGAFLPPVEHHWTIHRAADWVCAHSGVADRRIPLKTVARQCFSYFQIP